MSTKMKGRGKKLVDIPQENVVGSTTDAASVKKITAEKKTTKRKTTAKINTPFENGNSNGVTQDTEQNVPEEEPIKAKRGKGKKGNIMTASTRVENNKEDENIDKEEPLVRSGRSAKAAAKQSLLKTEVRSKRPVASKSVSEANGVNDITETKDPIPPKKAKGKGVPEIHSIPEQIEEEQEKVEDLVKVKKGRTGRAKKDAENALNVVEKKTVKTAGAKKIVSGARKGKRATETNASTPDLDEECEPLKAEKKMKATLKTTNVPKKLNSIDTKYDSIDFNLDKNFNFKISSWNIAGLRAWLTKGGLEFIHHEKPDILCLQETKCVPELVPSEAHVLGYHLYQLCKPGGNAGVAIYSKIMPINVEYDLGDEEQDESGRLMTAEYEKFFLVCVYVPNSGKKLINLAKRMRWDNLFQNYIKKLNEKKPVIICGDMNVSHQEIDLANPKNNKRSAGFTIEERDGMTKLLSMGFIDSFRYFYPDITKAYTFWTYMMNARSKNVGWRLDYFIVSEKIMLRVVDSIIRSQVLGSDHCPITLFLNI